MTRAPCQAASDWSPFQAPFKDSALTPSPWSLAASHLRRLPPPLAVSLGSPSRFRWTTTGGSSSESFSRASECPRWGTLQSAAPPSPRPFPTPCPRPLAGLTLLWRRRFRAKGARLGKTNIRPRPDLSAGSQSRCPSVALQPWLPGRGQEPVAAASACDARGSSLARPGVPRHTMTACPVWCEVPRLRLWLPPKPRVKTPPSPGTPTCPVLSPRPCLPLGCSRDLQFPNRGGCASSTLESSKRSSSSWRCPPQHRGRSHLLHSGAGCRCSWWEGHRDLRVWSVREVLEQHRAAPPHPTPF